MLLSLVHFLGEAATRRMAHRLGSRLDVSHAFSRHRASGYVPRCRTLKQAEEVAMQCPVCTTGLQITERQGIEIDYCPQCRGVWLDRGELDKLIEFSLTVPSAALGGQRHAAERPGLIFTLPFGKAQRTGGLFIAFQLGRWCILASSLNSRWALS